MEITVLGKYGPFAKNGGSTSSYLVKGKSGYIMLDCGAGSVSKMLNMIDINDLECLVLSHTHFDHASDILVLSYAIDFLRKDEPLAVYMPKDDSKLYNLVNDLDAFKVIPIKDEDYVKFFFNDYKVNFFKMEHPVLTYGITMQSGDTVLGYTADTKMCKNVEEIAKYATFLIADGAFLERDFSPSKPHMSVLEVANLAKKYNVKTLISHIGYNYSDEEIEQEIKDYKNFVEVAKENKTYKI
ncbi:MAG: MBL fold metallo-hydrolase [Clostridia bacterium]|nr:MBL fold metallo-hydrolase [Clostridia bacterium]